MKWLAVALVLALGACGTDSLTVTVTDDAPTILGLKKPEPLKLETYEFEIVTVDGRVLVGLTEQNYAALERNFDAIQGRLQLLGTIIDQYQNFYERPKK